VPRGLLAALPLPASSACFAQGAPYDTPLAAARSVSAPDLKAASEKGSTDKIGVGRGAAHHRLVRTSVHFPISRGLMQITPLLVRLKTLHPRHKLIAAAISLMAVSASLVLARSLPRAYSSSALLSFDAQAAQPGEQAKAQAESILSDGALSKLANQLGLFRADSQGAQSRQAAQFRARLTIATAPGSKLRVTWRSDESAQAQAATNAVADLLASWIPAPILEQHSSSSTPAPRTQVSKTTITTESQQRSRDLRGSIDQLKARHKALLSDESQLFPQLDQADRKLAALDVEQHRLAWTVEQAKTERQQQMNARRPTETKLAAAQKNLEDLRARYTEENPDVRAAKDKVAELETQLAALPAVRSLPQADQANLDATLKEIGDVRSERGRLLQSLVDAQTLDKTLRDRLEVLALSTPPAISDNAQLAPPRSDAPQEQVQNRAAASLARANSANAAIAVPSGRSPFQILQRASAAQPVDGGYLLLEWLGVAAGMVLGLLYLAFALWWFRVVQGVAALEKFVPAEVVYVGAIPRIVR